MMEFLTKISLFWMKRNFSSALFSEHTRSFIGQQHETRFIKEKIRSLNDRGGQCSHLFIDRCQKKNVMSSSFHWNFFLKKRHDKCLSLKYNFTADASSARRWKCVFYIQKLTTITSIHFNIFPLEMTSWCVSFDRQRQ